MLDLKPGARETVVRAMHARIAAQPGVADPDRLLFDLLERMILAPVSISADAALPHARTDTVDRMMLAVARVAAPGVAFDAEHRHVRLVFMIVVPKAQVDEYLAAMAAVSRIVKHEEVRAGLLAAATPEEFGGWLARGADR